ncbi:MAG: chemotaxis protein CheA [Planctomycetota bacterium]
MADDGNLHDAFIESSREALTELDNTLVHLEGGRDDANLLPQLRRILHTIKGGCSMFGLARAAAAAHALEDLAATGARRGGLPAEVVGLCFEGGDLLRGLIERFASDGDEGDEAGDLLESFVDRVRLAERALAAPTGGGVDATAAEALLREVAAVREELDGFADFAELDEAAEALRASLAAGPAPDALPDALAGMETGNGTTGAAPAEDTLPAAERTIRIGERKIDDFLHSVGELIEVSEVCKHLRRRMGQAGLSDATLREFGQAVLRLDDRVFTLHRALMDLRRVTVGSIFDHLPRLVRDTAHELGREVELVCEGAEAAVDKSLLDQVEACAVQLVRNAVAHGIEPPDDRAAAGKPPRGRVLVRARNEDRFLLLTVEDDGRGLDHDRIRERAVALGAIGAREAEQLSDEEAGRLIFASGLSTADGVGMASGRGVGLDVVAEEVARLGGGVTVESTPGRGAAITVRIPLDVTLSVRNGLVARTGALRFVAPSEAVLESVHPTAEMVSSVAGRGETLQVHGALVPLHRSGRIFGIPGAVDNPVDGVAMVLEADGRRAAYLFDEVLEMQQVVVKPIAGIPLARGVSGGAVLGDGGVGLVLDPEALLAASNA